MALEEQLQKIAGDYERRHEEDIAAIRQLANELERISSTHYAGGIPNNNFNRGDEGDAFSFPAKWAFTCKRMANSSYLAPLLTFYKSIFSSFDYEIKFDESENTDTVKTIKTFLDKQFKRAGGLREFITNVAVNTLVYGFFYFTPKLEIVNGKQFGLKGKYDGLMDFKYFDPTGLYNFTFDEKDSDKLSAISIMSAPKKVGSVEDKDGNIKGYTEEDLFMSLIINQSSTLMNIINIDVKSSLMGYCTYGDITGSPLGKPFFYDIYSLWKVIDAMDSSFNKNLENIGEHSFNFVNTAGRELEDSEIKSVYKEVRKFLDGKGGIFVSKYGKLEKIEGIDGKKWNDIRDGMIAAIWKSKGADIKALGLTRGATKNLASYLQSDGIIIAQSIMQSILPQINKTFLRSYFDLNFKEYILKGDIDYPQIELVLPKTSDGQKPQEASAQSLSAAAKQKIKIKTAEETQSINKFEILKREPSGIEKHIITDSIALDSFLKNNINAFALHLSITLKPKLKEAAEQIIKNPKRDIKIWGMFGRQAFEKEIRISLEQIANESALLEAFYIAESFKLGNTAFEDELKTDVYIYAKKTADRYIKSQAFKDILNASLIESENFIRSYAAKQNTSFILHGKADTNKIITKLNQRIGSLKCHDFYELSKNTVLNAFTSVCAFEAKDMVSKVKNYALMRSGILENQCPRQNARIGKIYYADDEGNISAKDGEAYELPGSICKESHGLADCICLILPIPALPFGDKNV